MLLGYNLTGELSYTPTVAEYPQAVYVAETGFDEVKIDAAPDDSTLTVDKTDWTGNTASLASFDDETLNSGTFGTEITKIALNRKRVNDAEWSTIEVIEIADIVDNIFTYTDKYADPVETYEYALVPLQTDGTASNYSVNVIKTEMDGFYIYDRNTRYELYYNFSFNDFEHNMPNEVMEPIGGHPYPIVVYNGTLNYTRGGLKCLLFASDDGNDIDRFKEKQLREKIMSFLMNRKPKAIKAYDGTNMMIAITGNPVLSHEARGIYNLEIEFVEIGNMNDQIDLYKNGFIDIPTEIGGTTS
jgi:hypothetical protein